MLDLEAIFNTERDSPGPIPRYPVKATEATKKLNQEPGQHVAWEDCIEPPDPCPKCGGLGFWWNALEQHFCLKCDPPAAAIRLLEHAERIRKQIGLPSPAGAENMVKELRAFDIRNRKGLQ